MPHQQQRLATEVAVAPVFADLESAVEYEKLAEQSAAASSLNVVQVPGSAKSSYSEYIAKRLETQFTPEEKRALNDLGEDPIINHLDYSPCIRAFHFASQLSNPETFFKLFYNYTIEMLTNYEETFLITSKQSLKGKAALESFVEDVIRTQPNARDRALLFKKFLNMKVHHQGELASNHSSLAMVKFPESKYERVYLAAQEAKNWEKKPIKEALNSHLSAEDNVGNAFQGLSQFCRYYAPCFPKHADIFQAMQKHFSSGVGSKKFIAALDKKIKLIELQNNGQREDVQAKLNALRVLTRRANKGAKISPKKIEAAEESVRSVSKIARDLYCVDEVLRLISTVYSKHIIIHDFSHRMVRYYELVEHIWNWDANLLSNQSHTIHKDVRELIQETFEKKNSKWRDKANQFQIDIAGKDIDAVQELSKNLKINFTKANVLEQLKALNTKYCHQGRNHNEEEKLALQDAYFDAVYTLYPIFEFVQQLDKIHKNLAITQGDDRLPTELLDLMYLDFELAEEVDAVRDEGKESTSAVSSPSSYQVEPQTEPAAKIIIKTKRIAAASAAPVVAEEESAAVENAEATSSSISFDPIALTKRYKLLQFLNQLYPNLEYRESGPHTKVNGIPIPRHKIIKRKVVESIINQLTEQMNRS